MTLYRLLSGNHGRFEDGAKRRYHPGDTIELTDEQAARFAPGRLELVEPEPEPEQLDITRIGDTDPQFMRGKTARRKG